MIWSFRQPMGTNKLVFILLTSVLGFFSCGHDLSENAGTQSSSDEDSENIGQKKIQGGGVIANNSYGDVFLMALNDRVIYDNFCTAVKINKGVFLTAAHCVIQTRPGDSASPSFYSEWRTNQISFTNKNTVRRTGQVDRDAAADVISSYVRVPLETRSYSRNRWSNMPSLGGDSELPAMIAMDMAIVTVYDYSPKGNSYSEDDMLLSPSVNYAGVMIAYGYPNPGIKQGISLAVSYADGNYSCWSSSSGSGGSLGGDSGGPLYEQGATLPRIFSVVSVGNGVSTCGPAILTGPYYQWFRQAYKKASNEAKNIDIFVGAG